MNLLFCHAKRIFRQSSGHGAVLVLSISLASFIGCNDDIATVRKIKASRQSRQQAETKVDHLGEAVELIAKFVELDAETAGRQIVYHLNAWDQSREATLNATRDAANSEKSPSEADFHPTELLRTVADVIPYEEATDAVSQGTFIGLDVYHLRYSYLLRQVCSWVLEQAPLDPLWTTWIHENRESLGAQNTDSLTSAIKLFDWVTRNVSLEPMVLGGQTPTPPPLPLGMTFRGAGYRQTPYQTLFRGCGDALQRSTTFISLCRQESIPACMLGLADGKGNLRPWIVGALVGGELYLFDCGLGIPVPGPGQIGIATLTQARQDASILRRMNVPGWFAYPVTKDDIQQCVAMLALEPETVSLRSRRLQEALTGDLRMVLYEDADTKAAAFEALSGIATTRIWDVPLKARVYDAAIGNAAQEDPMLAFFVFSPWSVLDGQFTQAKRLSLGRWRHLRGQFETDETDSIEGAKPLYLSQRQPEFEIADLRIDVELQKQYGIRRELGITPEVYDRQIQQVQSLMRQGKITATYWISLIQYDTGRFDLTKDWLATRILGDNQDSRWEQSARYNLARVYENLGDTEKAIELYKTEGDFQEHGNRIRARLISRSKEDAPKEDADVPK